MCIFVGANSTRRDIREAIGLLGGQREPRPRRACPTRAPRPRGQGLRKTNMPTNIFLGVDPAAHFDASLKPYG